MGKKIKHTIPLKSETLDRSLELVKYIDIMIQKKIGDFKILQKIKEEVIKNQTISRVGLDYIMDVINNIHELDAQSAEDEKRTNGA